MKDYLSVIITDGTNEWQQQGIAVPRIGDHITCRRDGSMEEVFGGEVDRVHWGVRDERPGMVVTVWLKEDAKAGGTDRIAILEAENNRLREALGWELNIIEIEMSNKQEPTKREWWERRVAKLRAALQPAGKDMP